jgi:hypothetical protein
MYMDGQLIFSDAQAITVDAISTNVIDLGATNTLKDIGAGVPLYLVIQIGVAWAAAGTVTFSLESDSTVDLATSATVHWVSADIAKSVLVAGYRVVAIALPIEKTYERYLGVRYNVTTSETAGTVDAFLVSDVNAWSAYADNFAIA